MHIGLNLLHAHPNIGGGWNYIKNIVHSLQSYDMENIYTIYCTSVSKRLVKEQRNTKIICVGIDGTNRFDRIVYENTYLQWKIRNDDIDVLHWFANTRSIYSSKPSLVTVYDLLAFRYPQSHSLLNRMYMRSVFPLSLRNANVVAPMSETTKGDIINRFKVGSEKLIVIPPIIDDMFKFVESGMTRHFRDKYRLPDKFWLYVSHYYPHKNHERLFKAYALLKTMEHKTWPLVLCGMKNGADALILEKLNDAGIQNNVIWLPRIDDNEMPMLYSAATALVFPSLFEGGGIPIMEALSCGCPVVASDLPAIKEFAGTSAVLYFNKEDVKDIANVMHRFENNDLVHECKMYGLEKAKTYRKEIIIPRLLNAYRAARENRLMNHGVE